MPIYEYKCRECGSKFERLVRSFAPTGVKCPQCGSEQTEKLVSSFARVGVASGFDPGSLPSSSSCGPGGFN